MSKLFDIADFLLVRAIKTEQSLSAAAATLNLSRSAVTKRLQKIESAIGKPVLCPTGNRHFTEHGKIFLDFSLATLKKYDDFLAQLSRARGGISLIRIAGNTSIMQIDVPGVLSALSAQHAEVEFEISDASFDKIMQQIVAGHIEIGIVPHDAEIEGLLFYHYKTERICVLAHRDHPLAAQASATLADICKHKLIGTSRHGIITSALTSAASKAGQKPQFAAHINDYDLHASMIAARPDGAGITFDCIAEKYTCLNTVKIDIDEPWSSKQFFIVTQKYDNQSPIIRQFIQMMTGKK